LCDVQLCWKKLGRDFDDRHAPSGRRRHSASEHFRLFPGCLAALIVTFFARAANSQFSGVLPSYGGLSECRAALSLDLKDNRRDLSPMTRQRRFTEDSAPYVTGRYDSSAVKAAVRGATEESLNGM
jgi:hypothetical protein